MVGSRDGRHIFITGHSEYDPLTLKGEYDRDVKKGLPINVPRNYFPHDDPSQPICTDVAFIGRTCYVPHERYEEEELTGPNIHSSPNYWAGPDPRYGLIYNMPEKDHLRAFRYDKLTGLVETTPYAVSKVRAPDGMPGGFLSLSAQGTRNGIIWALIPKADGQWVNGPGRMVAFDALTLNELWRDDDNIGFAKFMPPTVAGGKVYVRMADKLYAFGDKSASK